MGLVGRGVWEVEALPAETSLKDRVVHEGPQNESALGPVLESTQVRAWKGCRLAGGCGGAGEGVQFRVEQEDLRLIHADLCAQWPFLISSSPLVPSRPLFLFSGGAH